MFTRKGDGSGGCAGDNRCPHIDSGGSNVLEWRPRLFVLMLVVVLVGLMAGYVEFNGHLNWEW